MDSIDVHPWFTSMQVRNDCNAQVKVSGPVPELQIVARDLLAEQRLPNHGICCRGKTNEPERSKPLQKPTSRHHGLNSRSRRRGSAVRYPTMSAFVGRLWP